MLLQIVLLTSLMWVMPFASLRNFSPRLDRYKYCLAAYRLATLLLMVVGHYMLRNRPPPIKCRSGYYINIVVRRSNLAMGLYHRLGQIALDCALLLLRAKIVILNRRCLRRYDISRTKHSDINIDAYMSRFPYERKYVLRQIIRRGV